MASVRFAVGLLVASASLAGCSLLFFDDEGLTGGPSLTNDAGVEPAIDANPEAAVSVPEDSGDVDVDVGPLPRIYVFGGSPDASMYVPAAEPIYAEVLADGSLGPWTKTAMAPVGRRMNLGAVTGAGFIAMVAGFGTDLVPSGEQDTVTVGRLGADGLVTTFWNSGALLLARRAYNGAAFHAGYLYAIGGVQLGGTVLSDVVYGSLNATSTGAFAATSSLPNPTSRMGVTKSATHLYVVGGADGATKHDTIVKAAFEAGGSLSAFTLAGTLPSPRHYLQAVVHASSLVVVGGDGTSYLSEVVVYSINGVGDLGEPRTTVALPYLLSRHQAVLCRGRLYVIGGASGGTPRADVLFAELENDGSVSAWQATTPLPEERIFHAATVVE